MTPHVTGSRIALATGLVTACASACVLSVGIGGKRCDAKHDCVPGYVCSDGVCEAISDLRDAGFGFSDAGGEGEGEGALDAGALDAGVVDAGAVDGGEVVDAGDEPNPDGGTCVPAQDGVERCNDFDDDCNGIVDDGCAENDCSDDDSFPDALISVCTLATDWQTAGDVCRARGMELAVLEDARFADAVQGAVSDKNGGHDTWIGASDLAGEGTFLWVDGSELRFEDFAPGQPNNLDGDQDCVVSNADRWNDVACDETHGFVCVRPPPSPSTGPFCNGGPVSDGDGDGEDCSTDCNDADPSIHSGGVEVCGDRVDNDCDGLVDEACAGCKSVGVGGALVCERPTTWEQARDKCHDLGMHLGKIESQELEDAVNDLLVADGPDCWIGLNDRASPGTNVWDDGSPLGSFHPFGEGQPSNPDTQNCFNLRDSDPAGVDGGPTGDDVYEWHDVPCDDVFGAYLCTP